MKRTAYRFLLLSCVLVGGSSSVYAGIEPRFADPIQPQVPPCTSTFSYDNGKPHNTR